MSTTTLIRKAMDAGVFLELIDGKIKVKGTRFAVTQWRDRLRIHKAEIFQNLSAANDPEPPKSRAQWLEIDREYQRHHWTCPTCIAGSQGYGLRCGTGSALWNSYQNN